ncbi:hypothetical protein M2440_004720 [Methylorubrum extorquens]|nr:hypothetical protein [Methylorubrum extorquens]
MAEPITAISTRCSASVPMVAPTSSTTLSPRTVGHRQAMAGRSIPAMVLRQIFDIAIKAPVLPAETAAWASPSRTAWIARHIEDLPRPWRTAWLGLSSMAIETVVWRISTAPFRRGSASTRGRTTASSPNRMK